MPRPLKIGAVIITIGDSMLAKGQRCVVIASDGLGVRVRIDKDGHPTGPLAANNSTSRYTIHQWWAVERFKLAPTNGELKP